MLPFPDRAARLPDLGVGISTEHGAIDVPGAVDPLGARQRHRRWLQFLEVGVEVEKGLDRLARAWAQAGLPTTYHFLDLNLDDPADLDPDWLQAVRGHVATLRPAWLCGDAGLWHFGPRDRNQMLLLPPILSREAAAAMAHGVIRLREESGAEVLPENPPGTAFAGPLHIAEFFAELALAADTGLVVDCAHLALYQRVTGRAALDQIDQLPFDHVVELHIAGGRTRQTDGFAWVEDDHGPVALPDTWRIAEHIARRAPNLKAIVVECERNPIAQTRGLFSRAEAVWSLRPRRRGPAAPPRPPPPAPPPFAQSAHGRLQAELVARHMGITLPGPVDPAVAALDPRAFATDPLRPLRLLTALLEEFPVSVALAGLDRARAYLTAPTGLAACLADHGVVATSFAAFLAPQAGPLGAVEAALARCRRPAPRRRGLSPGHAVIELPAGGLQAWLGLAAKLGAEPARAVAEGLRLDPPALPLDVVELVLIQPQAGGGFVPSVEEGPFAALLRRLMVGEADAAALIAVLGQSGLEEAEAHEILDGLRAEGLLVDG
jgi:uncharacterized protein (UPF0276 family)